MSDPSNEVMEVTIAGMTFDVPVYETAERTREIARDVEARFRQIEAAHKKVNTQLFALKAAMSFAVDAARARAGNHDQDKELVKAIADMVTKVRNQASGGE